MKKSIKNYLDVIYKYNEENDEDEIITNIEEDDFDKDGGYIITTNKQIIKILIELEEKCCESSGYISSEDNFDNFIGAKILNITTTDDIETKDIKYQEIKKIMNDKEKEFGKIRSIHGNNDDSIKFMNTYFVNIETDKGKLQFAVYNFQNGYYGHEIKIEFNSKKINNKI